MSGTAISLIITLPVAFVVIFILIIILSIITCHKKKQSAEPGRRTHETVDGVALAMKHNVAYDRAQIKTIPADISTLVAEATYEEPVVEADYEVMEENQ